MKSGGCDKEINVILHKKNQDYKLAISFLVRYIVDPESKFHGPNMGPTLILSSPDGSHVGPMNLAIRGCLSQLNMRGSRPRLWAF